MASASPDPLRGDPGDGAASGAHRWLWWLPAVVTMAGIATLSHQPELPSTGGLPDWLLHGVEYGFLAVTCVVGATEGLRAPRWSGRALLVALLVAVVYGALDEVHQSFVGRDMSLGDWVADAVGAILATGLVGLLGPRRPA